MVKQNKNYYDMNKDELKFKIDKSERILKKIEHTFFGLLGTTCFVLANVVTQSAMPNDIMFLNGIYGKIVISIFALSYTGLIISSFIFEKEINSLQNARKQLDNIITMDYEKKRYQNDKEFEKINNNAFTSKIKNLDQKIKLLEDYKKELLNYDLIQDNDKKINNELKYYQYTKKILNDIK